MRSKLLMLRESTNLHRRSGSPDQSYHAIVSQIRNQDGTTGQHWTIEQTSQAMSQRGIKADPLEFWATMNMAYSDYVNVAKRFGIDNVDFYSYLADAFINDIDAADNKVEMYFKHIK